MHYSAAWTESGCLLGCSHEHETIGEANPAFHALSAMLSPSRMGSCAL